jgi:hypothetical protein
MNNWIFNIVVTGAVIGVSVADVPHLDTPTLPGIVRIAVLPQADHTHREYQAFVALRTVNEIRVATGMNVTNTVGGFTIQSL